jgi:hypothetical protein
MDSVRCLSLVVTRRQWMAGRTVFKGRPSAYLFRRAELQPCLSICLIVGWAACIWTPQCSPLADALVVSWTSRRSTSDYNEAVDAHWWFAKALKRGHRVTSQDRSTPGGRRSLRDEVKQRMSTECAKTLNRRKGVTVEDRSGTRLKAQTLTSEVAKSPCIPMSMRSKSARATIRG